MKYSHIYTSSVLCGALVLGCVLGNTGNDTQNSTSSTTAASSTSSTTSGDQSGSVTSAPGSATDVTVGDSAPTMATTTTTIGPATTSDGPSTGEGCSFLNCDDVLDTTECDHWAQDCPEGQKCAPYIAFGGGSWDSTKCVEVTGTDQPGEACTSEGAVSGIDSCVEGVMCWGVDSEGNGTCVALCTGDPGFPVCDPPGYCTVGGDGIIILCLPVCDPLLQDCPDPTQVCYADDGYFYCTWDASGDEGQANDPCEFSDACDPGLMCGEPALVGMGCEPGSTGCCTPFCKFPDGACPNPDQQCVQYLDPMLFPPGDSWLDVGVCGVPG